MLNTEKVMTIDHGDLIKTFTLITKGDIQINTMIVLEILTVINLAIIMVEIKGEITNIAIKELFFTDNLFF